MTLIILGVGGKSSVLPNIIAEINFQISGKSDFGEQTIRDDVDFAQHLDDLHFNPVKHGYVDQVINWEYSSFHGMRAVALIPQIGVVAMSLK